MSRPLLSNALNNNNDMSRQAIIDGNFQVCQIGTTSTNPASGTYPVFDMWKTTFLYIS